MKAELISSLEMALAEATNAEEGLFRCFQILKSTQSGFSFERFARKTGFASRSYVRAIVTGSKKLTPAAAKKFAKGLELSPEAVRHLLLLANVNENKKKFINTDGEKQRHARYMELSRARLLSTLASKSTASSSASSSAASAASNSGTEVKLYANFDTPYVYAALGDCEKGATLKEISKRSGLSTSQIRNALVTLAERNLLKIVHHDGTKSASETRYIPISSSLWTSEKDSKQHFKNFFIETLIRSQKIAQEDFFSDQHCFVNSVFSVKKNEIPILKKKLRELIENFAVESERAGGDTVMTLSTLLTR
jgi:transcriptional regulator with XRE-family HTH domain/DNA-binding MarR family transcriptional regulator